MSEQSGFEHTDESVDEYVDAPDEEFGDDYPDAADQAPAATGHPAVDEVLRSLESLGDSPVDEHVAVFEQAHDQLRRTLSGAGDED